MPVDNAVDLLFPLSIDYAINSILFQRGIYPPESFKSTQQYGVSILMSEDEKIQTFIKNVLSQAQEWLAKNEIDLISMIIKNVHTQEVLECWEFKVQSEPLLETKNGAEPISNKDNKRIQQEIGSVMRQISATVSYLPLIDCVCSFDLFVYALKDCDVPKEWDETAPVVIQNSQSVQLRSFSTGLHTMNTVVNYKMSS